MSKRDRKQKHDGLIFHPAAWLVSLGLLITLAGCAVGPQFVAPQAPQASGYLHAPAIGESSSSARETQSFDTTATVASRWWTVFGSKALDALIDEALRSNPSVDSALASLRVAQANVEAQQGFFFPAVSAQYAPSRQRNAVGTLAPTLASNMPVYTLYTAQLAISYTPDVFGLNRRQVESLAAQREVARAQLRALSVTLATNVVAAVMQRATLKAEIEATQKIIADQSDAFMRTRHQQNAGYVAGLDVAAQQAALAQVRATLPPLQKQLDQTVDLLAALVYGDSTHAVPEIDLDELTLPDHLPLSVPSQLIWQRPDVQAALEELHAATANAGMADAALLPQFAITAAYGGASTNMASLFRPDNIFWSIVGSATQTIFDGGTLLARKRAADAGIDAALGTYKMTVVSALQNVADTLYALKSDGQSMDASQDAETAAKRSLDLTQKQLDAGYTNFLAVLMARQAYQQAVLGRLQARGAWLADTASLFQALGGGWWNADAGNARAFGLEGERRPPQ